MIINQHTISQWLNIEKLQNKLVIKVYIFLKKRTNSENCVKVLVYFGIILSKKNEKLERKIN